MSFAVLAKHRGGEREIEVCRVGTKASAKSIAAGLAAETYKEKPPDKTRAHSVPRYLSVRVQKVQI